MFGFAGSKRALSERKARVCELGQNHYNLLVNVDQVAAFTALLPPKAPPSERPCGAFVNIKYLLDIYP